MISLSSPQIVGGLVAVLIATYGATFAWIVRRFDRLEERFDAKLERLEAKFDSTLTRLDEKFSARIDALTIAVSRLEGAVLSHSAASARRVDR